MLSVAMACSILSVSSFDINAERVSPQQALERAIQYDGSAQGKSIPNGMRKIKSRSGEMKLAATRGMVYIFNSAPDCFLVLPADDKAPAILGYSDSGEYTPGENPTLDYWIREYSRQLEYAAGTGSDSYSPNATLSAVMTSRESRKPIEPIVKTEWNQTAPYNDLCPKVNGHETVTGCVATAMAQVIRTHEWPAKGKGTKSYYWHVKYDGIENDSTLSFNYDDVTFDYAEMPYRYDKDSTPTQRHAVAELMLACGISVDMWYDIGGSGASTWKMGASLIDIFDYDKSLWMPSRNYYDLSEWENMIYADLAKGLPVLYSGEGTDGGHQFICDGYSSDGYFHFNWGWGGASNGYFLLDALNPGTLGVGGGAGGFNYGQQACLNLFKPVDGSRYTYVVYMNGNLTSSQVKVTAGEELTLGGGFYNYSLHRIPADSYFGMAVINAEGDTTYVEGNEAYQLDPVTGMEDMYVKWPELKDGVYTIRPAFKDVYGQWQIIRASLDKKGSFTATVADGVATLTQAELPSARVHDIVLNSKLFIDTEFSVSFTVTNDGDSEYIWNVAPALLNSDGDVVAKGETLEVDLTGGQSRDVEKMITTFTEEKGYTLKPGDYTLTVINTADDKSMASKADELTVSIAGKPATTKLEVRDFKIDNAQPVTDKEDVRFSFTLDCTEGYCSDNLNVYIFHAYGGYDIMSKGIESPLISAGESKEITVDFDMNSLEADEYMALIDYKGEYIGDRVYFRIGDSTTGIATVEIDGSDLQLFDLKGYPVYGIPSPGIYATRKGLIMIR